MLEQETQTLLGKYGHKIWIKKTDLLLLKK